MTLVTELGLAKVSVARPRALVPTVDHVNEHTITMLQVPCSRFLQTIVGKLCSRSISPLQAVFRSYLSSDLSRALSYGSKPHWRNCSFSRSVHIGQRRYKK